MTQERKDKGNPSICGVTFQFLIFPVHYHVGGY